MTEKITKLLSTYDIKVVNANHLAIDTPLRDRVAFERSFSNAKYEKIYVSIHANASRTHDIRGFEVFHNPKSILGRRLAYHVYNEVVSCFQSKIGGSLYKS